MEIPSATETAMTQDALAMAEVIGPILQGLRSSNRPDSVTQSLNGAPTYLGLTIMKLFTDEGYEATIGDGALTVSIPQEIRQGIEASANEYFAQ